VQWPQHSHTHTYIYISYLHNYIPHTCTHILPALEAQPNHSHSWQSWRNSVGRNCYMFWYLMVWDAIQYSIANDSLVRITIQLVIVTLYAKTQASLCFNQKKNNGTHKISFIYKYKLQHSQVPRCTQVWSNLHITHSRWRGINCPIVASEQQNKSILVTTARV